MKRYAMNQIVCSVLFALVLLCSCHQNNTVADNYDIIPINADKNHPLINLKLSEIAEISYIPLKTDDILISNGSMSRMIFLYKDKIYVGDHDLNHPKLVVFDRFGSLVQVIGSKGRGPGEYINLTAFAVDTITNEIFVFDRRQLKFIVYDIDGKFKREKSLQEMNRDQKWLDEIEIINDNYILAYNKRSLEVATADFRAGEILVVKKGQTLTFGKTIMIIDKQTLSEVRYRNFEYAKAGMFRVYTVFYPLISLSGGVYIASERSDTIYFMNRNLEIIPKFRDVTDYKSKYGGRIIPVAETERYTFFITRGASVALDIDDRNNFVQIAKRFFVYDKELETVFHLNNGLPEKDVEDGDNNIALLNDQIALNEYSLTLNHNYAVTTLFPNFLFEHYNQLPKELKEIIKSLREDDNPVIMLIKLK